MRAARSFVEGVMRDAKRLEAGKTLGYTGLGAIGIGALTVRSFAQQGFSGTGEEAYTLAMEFCGE